jgi:hypothetical protein
MLFGISVLGTTVRMSPVAAISGAITTYIMSLITVYVLALIIDALAPTFQGTKNQMQALKVAVYSSTAAWLAGVFILIPALGFLQILGLYSLYLLYLGLPRLMKTPEDKALVYTAIVIVAAFVIFAVIGAVGSFFISYPMPR